MALFGSRTFGGANGSTSSSLLRSAACWKSSSWFSLRPGCMSTERPAPRPGTGVRPRIRSSVNARSGREPKEQRPDRGAGRGQTGPAASGYAVLVAPTLSRVPDGGSEGGAPTIRSARAVPGPAPQGVASQRPRPRPSVPHQLRQRGPRCLRLRCPVAADVVDTPVPGMATPGLLEPARRSPASSSRSARRLRSPRGSRPPPRTSYRRTMGGRGLRGLRLGGIPIGRFGAAARRRQRRGRCPSPRAA